jgi:outer membrane protein
VRSYLMLFNGSRGVRVPALACMALSAMLGLSGIASAQTAATQKFAVIDMQSALISTKDGQKAVAELKAKFSPKEQEFQKRQQELQSKQDQYRKTENTISEDAKASLARDIDAMTKNLQRDTDDARQDVEQEQQRVLQVLGQKMMQVLQKYAVEKQITMVFDVSGQPNNVLFASNTIDITRDIIAAYDAAPPASSASTSAPASKPAGSSNPAPTPAAPKRPAPTGPASK